MAASRVLAGNSPTKSLNAAEIDIEFSSPGDRPDLLARSAIMRAFGAVRETFSPELDAHA